jgi:hypothetical protein
MLAAAIVLAAALRITFGPAPIAANSWAEAKLGAADPFTAPIEMAASDTPKPHAAD